MQFLYPSFSLLTKTLRLLGEWRRRNFLVGIFREPQGEQPFVLFQVCWLSLGVVSQNGLLKFRLQRFHTHIFVPKEVECKAIFLRPSYLGNQAVTYKRFRHGVVQTRDRALLRKPVVVHNRRACGVNEGTMIGLPSRGIPECIS